MVAALAAAYNPEVQAREPPMPAYPLPVIHTRARTEIKVGTAILRVPWGPAADVKAKAAKQLRDLPLVGNADIEIRLWQKSPDVPWTDGGGWWWNGAAAAGREYGAQWLEVFPAWGGGR
jgi:hypothetical protein